MITVRSMRRVVNSLGFSLLLSFIVGIGCNTERVGFSAGTTESLSNIPQEHRDRLEAFFSYLVHRAGAAYTLFGPKPWTVESFPHKTPTQSSFSLYHPEVSLSLRLGWESWMQYKHVFSGNTYSIHCVPLRDRLADHSYVVVINRPATLMVIRRHLPLFQELLKTDASPEELLRLMESSEAVLSECTQQSTLLGILLGYGARNAQGFSRRAQISTYLNSLLKPPGFPEELGALSPLSNRSVRAYRGDSQRTLSPSPSFKSLAEELNSMCAGLKANQCGDSHYWIQRYAPPVFVAFEGEPETVEWLEAYAKTRDRLPNFLDNSSLLEAVFDRWTSGQAETLPTRTL